MVSNRIPGAPSDKRHKPSREPMNPGGKDDPYRSDQLKDLERTHGGTERAVKETIRELTRRKSDRYALLPNVCFFEMTYLEGVEEDLKEFCTVWKGIRVHVVPPWHRLNEPDPVDYTRFSQSLTPPNLHFTRRLEFEGLEGFRWCPQILAG